MSDTQWPRYEVFKKDNAKKPYEAIGSVHAPDGEMALLNARNVFVRRPSAVSLWVTPESAIFSITAQEMELNPEWYKEEVRDDIAPQTFYVFNKQSQRRAMIFVRHVGEVVAQTAVQAIHRATQNKQLAKGEVFVWWAVPKTAVTSSETDDIESMFAPAKDKTYRQQSHYGFVDPRAKKNRD